MAKNTKPRGQDSTTLKRRWMGSFLRAKRESLQPKDVGLPAGGRRRTPGLRREEVAVLANVGATWYTWLEQGRDISVSASVLDSIAQALRLDDQELEHLYRLAGRVLPDACVVDESMTGRLACLLESIQQTPAYISDRYWNTLAANDLGKKLFALEEGDNCLTKFFTDPKYAARYPFHEAAAEMMVAQFRKRAAAYPSDPTFELIANQLSRDSAEFAKIWRAHRVNQNPHMEVAIDHETLGRLTFESIVLNPTDGEDVTMFTYIPSQETATLILRLK